MVKLNSYIRLLLLYRLPLITVNPIPTPTPKLEKLTNFLKQQQLLWILHNGPCHNSQSDNTPSHPHTHTYTHANKAGDYWCGFIYGHWATCCTHKLTQMGIRNATHKSLTIIITIYGYYKWMFATSSEGEGHEQLSLKNGYPVSRRQLEMLIRIATEIDRREIRVLCVVNPGQRDTQTGRMIKWGAPEAPQSGFISLWVANTSS